MGKPNELKKERKKNSNTYENSKFKWKGFIVGVLTGVLSTVVGGALLLPITEIFADQKLIESTKAKYHDIIAQKSSEDVTADLKSLLISPDARFNAQLRSNIYQRLYTNLSGTAMASKNPVATLAEADEYLVMAEKLAANHDQFSKKVYMTAKARYRYEMSYLFSSLDRNKLETAYLFLEEARNIPPNSHLELLGHIAVLDMLCNIQYWDNNLPKVEAYLAEWEAIPSKYKALMEPQDSNNFSLLAWKTRIAINKAAEDHLETSYNQAEKLMIEVREMTAINPTQVELMKCLNIEYYRALYLRDHNTDNGKRWLSAGITEGVSLLSLVKDSPQSLNSASLRLFDLYSLASTEAFFTEDKKDKMRDQMVSQSKMILEQLDSLTVYRPFMIDIVRVSISYNLAETPADYEDVNIRAEELLNISSIKNAPKLRDYLLFVIKSCNLKSASAINHLNS